MVIGPGWWERCKNKPTVIAHQNKPGDDGLKGSMSLCQDCWKRMIDVCGTDFATVTPI